MTIPGFFSALLRVAALLSTTLFGQHAYSQMPVPAPTPSNVEPVVAPPQPADNPPTVVTPPHTAPPCVSASWLAAQNTAIRELIVLQANEAAAVTEERSETGLKEDEILKKRLKYLKALIKLSGPSR